MKRDTMWTKSFILVMILNFLCGVVGMMTLPLVLEYAKEILVQENKDGIGEDAVSVVVSDAVVYMPLEDLVDREKEIERLKKEQERLAKEIARCQGMLSNPNFVNKAPEAKVNAEKEKLQKYEEMMEKVKTQLTQMDK